ncbi:hypothetical protein [Campylobacter volucris]|uniref:hypothetical protein n=1 Tax=Campylobacter volucris TaxID=1031542 RepID=UPI00140504E6|nr:hypothetical protein [Campylobacter volucris]MBF7044248.1 hypothetical protein [Campylobacter volucris]MBF7046723.1 hypothetical protein [Campylobacter volucris]MBF7066778.1 hypothetical protein [Campylobacter volucris]
MIKKLILKYGRTLLDTIAVICFILAIIYSIGMMVALGFIAGLIALIASSIGILLSFFTIYLIIDIRDALVNKTGGDEGN